MTQEDIIKEIGSLPPEGQRQVIDFIAFMRQRYSRSPLAEKTVVDLRSEAFIGMWRDREDLADSSEWVRRVRQSEWAQ